jgi:hypothetical protein
MRASVGLAAKRAGVARVSGFRLRDGKVVEHIGLNDVWLFAIQAGAVKRPAMPPASAAPA